MPAFLHRATMAVVVGLMSAFSAPPLLAQSQSVTGFNGADATHDGGRGGDGQPANLTSGSDNIIITTQGGIGGAGGPGRAAIPASGAIAPGAGGNGGDASATANASASFGPASATATASAGTGGRGGSGADAGQPDGAKGSDGNASAYANAYGQDHSTVTASASATGGIASVGAYGRSDGGGTVSASASLSQNGDIFLYNAVDGQTTGALFLTQNVTARTGSATATSAGNAFNTLSETRNGLTLLNASISAAGANGGSLSLPGGAGVASLSLNSDAPIVASETATGGNGGSDGYFANWGMTGLVEANINSFGWPNAAASLDAHAIGGNGTIGSPAAGDGGQGGSAAAQLSVFSSGNVSLHVTLNPGNGGAGVGTNHSGGMAGQADIETGDINAVAVGGGAADLAVTLHAGNGGDGIDGAFAAPGADATLSNAGRIGAIGDFSISQTAIAGNGGSARSDTSLGMTGSGGNARSELFRDDTINNAANPLITLNASATGGNGGDMSGAATTYFAPGAAGAATVTIGDSANRSLRVVGESFGGNGGADHGAVMTQGGAAFAMVNASSAGVDAGGDQVDATARATGGEGHQTSVDGTQNGRAIAIAASDAAGSASATAAAYAVGGAGANGGLGGDAFATSTATLRGSGTILSASATAIGGDGNQPYASYIAGGIANAEATVSQSWGTGTASAIGGNGLACGRGGFATALVRAGNVYVQEGCNALDAQGACASVAMSNGAFTIQPSADAQLSIDGGYGSTVSATVYTAQQLGLSTLSIANGVTLRIIHGGSIASQAVDFYNGGKLDLTRTTLTINDGTAAATHLAAVRGDLAAGEIFSSSADSSHTLGYLASNTTLSIELAYFGDANLDGKVDVIDLGLLASHWQQNGYWTGGDFNYDGKIDVIDLGLLASHWQAGAAGPGMSFEQATALVGLGNAGVPEPTAAWGVIVVAATLLRRRTAA